MSLLLDTSASSDPPASSTRVAPDRAHAVAELLRRAEATGGEGVRLVDASGWAVDLPSGLVPLLLQAAEWALVGAPFRLVAADAMLTTQAAARLLNVSRQYLVRLVDEGRLPAVRVGSHRRLRLEDVLAFKAVRDRQRQRALDELVALSEAIGGYDLTDPPASTED